MEDLKKSLNLSGQDGIEIVMGGNKSVVGFPAPTGIALIFIADGIQTRISLSYEALDVAYFIGQKLQERLPPTTLKTTKKFSPH